MSSAILAFQTGDRVLIEGPSSAEGIEGFERSGTIRFIGKTEFKEGDWLGVELDTPTGKNDGSVAGVRYFTCEPFHGLFVPPNKARLNLSGDSVFGEGMFSSSSRRLSNSMTSGNANNTLNFSTPSKQSAFGAVGGTPNHLDRIENLQMDFSAVKDISDSFTSQPSTMKTPTANVKSQNNTPATSELKNTQNDIFRLRDQIMSIKADLRNNSGESSSANRETVDSIVNKLSGMLESYEQVSSQYENQLKQFLMARKASKLDSSVGTEELTQKFNQEKAQILNEFDKLQFEYEKVRNDLYNEIKENDALKGRFSALEEELGRMRQRLSQQDEELKKSRFEGVRSRTELEVEMAMEEEHRKRAIEHENELKLLKARHEEELKQKKILIADLQNEVAFLKQSEKVLQEELNIREMSNRRLSTETAADHEIANAKRQAEEFKRLWEDAQAAKMRSEEYYRGEIERLHKESVENGEFDELKRDLKELGGRLKQTRADNEELTWALETSNKETERLNGLIEEQTQKLNEKEKKLQSYSERIQELEGREVQTRESESLQSEIKRLSLELGEERLKAAGPIEQVSALKRKVALIEREKELLEEQVRTARLSAYSQGEFQTFSTFIQGLKRHVEAEILSIEPLKLTLQDVVRAKEMVDILLKVTEDVRVKVLNHLSQVEEVIKSRFSGTTTSTSTVSTNASTNSLASTSTQSYSNNYPAGAGTDVETVKIERVRNFDSNGLADLRRRLDFRTEEQPRTLREPLGVTSIPSQYPSRDRPTGNASGQFARSSSSDYELENRMNNFRNLVSDLRSRQSGSTAVTRPNTSYNSYSQLSHNNNNNNNSNNFIRAHEPIRCNLCQEYGHDALSCPDYLSGAESFSEDLFLKDVRNSKFSSRFPERTRA